MNRGMRLCGPAGNSAEEAVHREAGAEPGRVFECKTCNRKFPTFQALGGHRTSHRKPKLHGEDPDGRGAAFAKPKVHECSVCGVEFAIGQALGGHMRRHKGEGERSSTAASTEKRSLHADGHLWLDLNHPPVEDEIGFLSLGPGVWPHF